MVGQPVGAGRSAEPDPYRLLVPSIPALRDALWIKPAAQAWAQGLM
jgi:hypothetical protein